jgi:RluA family pseudouridine synthase
VDAPGRRGYNRRSMPSSFESFPTTRLAVTRERAGLRADDFLVLELPFLSRTRIKQKIQMGESLLNGGRYASSARLKEGDLITIRWRAAPEQTPAPDLPVLYEDDFLLAVDKPAGIAVHPTADIQSGTLIQFVRRRLRASIEAGFSRGDPETYPNLVHRLDVFTSGIVLVAKRRAVLTEMHAMAARGEIEKRYVAVVEGLIETEAGRIELPIGPDGASEIRIKMAVRPDGHPSVTDYKVDRRLPAHTILHAFPRTGRQHQIRVHLAAAGHPVWGDLIYKDERLFLSYWGNGSPAGDALPPRHLLHADTVSFAHPVTGQRLVIESKLPPDFIGIVSRLEGGAKRP